MMSPSRLTVIIAEELALVRDGIASLCESSGLFQVVGSAPDGEQAWLLIQEKQPDLALIELSVGRLFALELLRMAREIGSSTRVVVFSSRRDRKTVIEVLRAGAQGYFVKSAPGDALIGCLEQVAAGGVYVSPEIDLQKLFTAQSLQPGEDPLSVLSAREYQVFNLLIEGVRAKEIAARLNLSPKTVDTYRSSLMRKLNIYDVAGLVRFAIQHGMITS
jgi:DNA-binding NarL/FixJ family response regulator